MAELEQSCCSPQTQTICCEPSDKAECCGPEHGDGCGCAASADKAYIRETVRERYAAYPLAARGEVTSPADREGAFGAALYRDANEEVLGAAVEASLGCGVPTAVADLHEGETVLDLGSGAGGDVLISALLMGWIS